MVVEINNLIFKGKRNFSWNEVERYAMKYLNLSYSIAENNKTIIIDRTSIDEMAKSNYNMRLKGKMKLIKANLIGKLEKIIRNATNERWSIDYNNKHKNKAKNGWYRYDVKFNYPLKNTFDEIIGKEMYICTMIVRIDEDNNNKLYDLINIKKYES